MTIYALLKAIFLLAFAGAAVGTILLLYVAEARGSVAGRGVLSVMCVQVALEIVAMSLAMTGISVPESLFLEISHTTTRKEVVSLVLGFSLQCTEAPMLNEPTIYS